MTGDPFGRVVSGLGSEARFAGQWFAAENGLHQNWMRDYDATLGRYIQPDPLGLIDGASVYGYARSNPARWSNPRGEDTTDYWNTEGGRSGWDGPTNGNWGGKCWSGGRYSCGPEGVGELPPTDSADVCYMDHDNCYTACDVKGAGQECIKTCDQSLVESLKSLPEDLLDWPTPPPKGTWVDTIRFMGFAIRYFGD